LLIEEKLEVISPANFLVIPPEHASVQWDHVDKCHWDSLYVLWHYPIRPGDGSEYSFSCDFFHHPLVVMLFVHHVGFDSDTEPVCRLSMDPYKPVFDSYLCCQFWQDVFVVASSVHQ